MKINNIKDENTAKNTNSGFKSRLGHRLQPIRMGRLFCWVWKSNVPSFVQECISGVSLLFLLWFEG